MGALLSLCTVGQVSLSGDYLCINTTSFFFKNLLTDQPNPIVKSISSWPAVVQALPAVLHAQAVPHVEIRQPLE